MNNTALTAEIMTTKTGRHTHLATQGSNIAFCGARVSQKAQAGSKATCEKCACTWGNSATAFDNEVEVAEIAPKPEKIEASAQPLTWAQMRAMKAQG